jgi:hypothetical protein
VLGFFVHLRLVLRMHPILESPGKFGVLFLAAVLASMTALRGANSAFLGLNYEEAINRAEAEKKPLLIFFHGSWSEDSREMHKETFGDARLQNLLRDRAVCISIDVVGSDVATRNHQVDFAPTTVLVCPDRLPLHRWRGSVSALRLIRDLKFLLFSTPVEDFRRTLKADSVSGRYELAVKLLASGAYDEALKELEWLYNRAPLAKSSRTAPDLDDATFEQALSRLCDLRQVHKPAAASLDNLIQADADRTLARPDLGLTPKRLAKALRATGQNERLAEIRRQVDPKTKTGRMLAPYLTEAENQALLETRKQRNSSRETDRTAAPVK